MLPTSEFGQFSESKLHTELDLTRSGSLIGASHLRGRLAESERVSGKVPRLAELDAIEQIVDLGAELQTEPLGQVDTLLQDGVPVTDSRPIEAIASEVSAAAEGRIAEEGEVGAGLRERIADRDWRSIRVKVRTCTFSRVRRINWRENVVGQAAREYGDTRQLPAAEDSAYRSLRPVGACAADRQLPSVVERQTLPHVEIGIASLGGKVQRVAWKLLIVGCGDQWIGGVVDGV